MERHPVSGPPFEKPGCADIANYSVSRRLARRVPYPTDYDPQIGAANHFRCFKRILAAGSVLELDLVVAHVQGNPSYRRLSEQLTEGLA